MQYIGRIKFGDREWLVIDKIEYEGTNYYYIIEDVSEELEKLENVEDYKENIAIEFIHKFDNDNYANVTDEKLFKKLSAIVGIKAINNLANLESE